ncbi:MAG: hypothetical protein WB975_08465 [Nitrososphaeraceae archaeon]
MKLSPNSMMKNKTKKELIEFVTLTQPRNSPFTFESGQVMARESRKVDRSGKTQHKRNFKQDLEQYKEQDIQETLRKGKKLVNYHES